MKNVDIRYNSHYPDFSKFQWRLLVDGQEMLVNEIICSVPTYTSTTDLAGLGKKYHISAKANDVIISFNSQIKSAHVI